MEKALEGIKVIDLTEALAGPYCGMMLGDFGADVVKVERPGYGDQARGYGPPFLKGESAYFLSINRNKRSVTLDLRTPEGQEQMKQLLNEADILLLNLPQKKSWEKYGIDYESIALKNPGIIYVAISGYGHTGPRAGDPGYDTIAQAESGTMSLTGTADGEPTRFPTAMADMTTGLYATIGALTALSARVTSGRGQVVETTLLESQVSWLTTLATSYFMNGIVPQPIGNAHPMLVPYRLYKARDHSFNVGVASEPIWERFCEAIGLPALAADPSYACNADRVRNRMELEQILEKHFKIRDADEWLERLHSARVPSGRLNSLPDILKDEHFLERGNVVEIDHPSIGAFKVLGNPIHFSETPVVYERHPPVLGEHTDEVLSSMNWT